MIRFQEEIVFGSGKFNVDTEGRVWRDGRRAEHKTRTGYLQVRVMIDKVRHYTTAHRLVWRALRGPIPHGSVINHRNGVKDDNRPRNLECVTASANVIHANRSGLRDQRGQKNPAAKLKDSQVVAIRMAYASGDFTQAEIAARFAVSCQCVSRIVRGERRTVQAGPTSDYTARRQFPVSRDEYGRITGRAGADPAEWPADLRVQQWPEVRR